MTNTATRESKTYAERTRNCHHLMVYIPLPIWPKLKEAASLDGMPISRWVVHTIHARLIEERLLAMGRPVEPPAEAIEED